MATFHFSFYADNTTGTTGYRLRYREHGASAWDTTDISGTTGTITAASPSLTDNLLYDLQVVNLSTTLGNPASAIFLQAGINGMQSGGDFYPTFSPTSTTIGYSFDNLSGDVDTYTLTIALRSSPGTILLTTTVTPGAYPSVVSGTFTGLTALTYYRITITPAIASFTKLFEYDVLTLLVDTCTNPINVIPSLS